MHNESGKFESSFLSLRVEDSYSVMLTPLVGSTLGIWVAHGEGKFSFNGEPLPAAASYAYSAYPGNPNGSDMDTAALCSVDGRHLAIMPHLERSIFPWQWAYYPEGRGEDQLSPWLLAFLAARKWVEAYRD
jgi:phosphoribosylformylglycinamidine synthase